MNAVEARQKMNAARARLLGHIKDACYINIERSANGGGDYTTVNLGHELTRNNSIFPRSTEALRGLMDTLRKEGYKVKLIRGNYEPYLQISW